MSAAAGDSGSGSSNNKSTLESAIFRSLAASLLLFDDVNDRAEVMNCIKIMQKQIDDYIALETKSESDKKKYFGGNLKRSSGAGGAPQIITGASSAKLESFVEDLRYLASAESTEEDFRARKTAFGRVIEMITTMASIIGDTPQINGIIYDESSGASV